MNTKPKGLNVLGVSLVVASVVISVTALVIWKQSEATRNDISKFADLAKKFE